MTWTRLDDNWCEQPAIADLSLEARWHYLAMIQFCSRTNRFEGVVSMADALRCSDVPDPRQAMDELLEAGLVRNLDGRVALPRIDEHVPPPSVREKAKRDTVRKRRSRAHHAGDHSMCYREQCEFGTLDEPKPQRNVTRSDTREVTRDDTRDTPNSHQVDVTSHVTPGRDGTGRDSTGSAEKQTGSQQPKLGRNENPSDSERETCWDCGEPAEPGGVLCARCQQREDDRLLRITR